MTEDVIQFSAPDPEALADLLQVGMVDRFVVQFKRAADVSRHDLPSLISQINTCLDAQQTSKNRMKPRLEHANAVDVSTERVDVVTPCNFVGGAWPNRQTITIAY